MTRRTLLSLILIGVGFNWACGVHAEDPGLSTTPPATSPSADAPVDAPVPPAGAVGLLIANRSSGFTSIDDKRQFQALFRGTLQTTPSGSRVLIYLLPVHDPSQEEVLKQTLAWSEVNFERQIPTIEASMGRIYFKRLPSSNDVLKAVSSDPGGVGIVSADTLLNSNVVILWPTGAP